MSQQMLVMLPGASALSCLSYTLAVRMLSMLCKLNFTFDRPYIRLHQAHEFLTLLKLD